MLSMFAGIFLVAITKTKLWNKTKPLYGKLAEDLVITKYGIIFKNKMHLFKEMQDFEIKLKDHYGNSSSWSSEKGYMRGVNNTIFFIDNHTLVHEHFLVSSGTEFATLQSIIDQAICQEKLTFKHRYLNMISDTYKQTEEYRQLIKKIKHKNHTFVF